MRLAVSLRPVASLAGVFTAAALVTSCATQAPATSGRTAGPSSQSDASTPTFYADVLPVLQENCQVCHIEQGLNLGGMIAPEARGIGIPRTRSA